jgi:hypothetical protein
VEEIDGTIEDEELDEDGDEPEDIDGDTPAPVPAAPAGDEDVESIQDILVKQEAREEA